MTDEEIKKDLEICEKATQGNWEFGGQGWGSDSDKWYTNIDILYNNDKPYEIIHHSDQIRLKQKEDAKFIAAAREGWPKALKEIQRLRKKALKICDDLGDEDELCRLLCNHPEELEFILAARTGWPKALEEIQRLRKKLNDTK